MNATRIVFHVTRFAAAVILLQTLYFKFSGAPESRYIFSMLHAEPWGRVASGIIELVAALLLFVRPLVLYGALLGLATMLGALAAHFFVIGIEVQKDGGTLFILALVVLFCCVYNVWYARKFLRQEISFSK